MQSLVRDAKLACSISYALRRHNETGRRYIVSDFPRALLDCAHNRQALRDMGESVDWTRIEAEQEQGRIGSNIYRGDNGRVYFYVGS